MSHCPNIPTTLTLAAALLAPAIQAQHADHIEVIGQQDHTQITTEINASYHALDPGELLKTLPGANINRNGPLTPIAQYRGLYGDRVGISIDGFTVIGTGPNSMDSPLSYVPMILLDNIQQHRGVAPVSAATDSLGGVYEVALRAMPNSMTDRFDTNIEGETSYRSNGEIGRAGMVLETSNRHHALQAFYDWQKGSDDLEAGGGVEISPTKIDKWVGGAKYQYSANTGHFQVWWQRFDTGYSGTPALPMDILYIDTDRVGLAGQFEWQDWQAELKINYSDGAHLMDNIAMRANGEMSDKMRENLAHSDDWQWLGKVIRRTNHQVIEFGTNGLRAKHDATISDPSNEAFEISNFAAIQDDKTSIYGSWSNSFDAFQLDAGLRLTYVEANSGEVSHSMATSSTMIATLVDNFNSAQRKQDDWLVDINTALHWQQSATWSYSLALGHKQRAASYQERYLWFPLEATAGLADGRTYIGAPNLAPETAWQIDLGSRWQTSSIQFEPHLFYQRIDDYIQGTEMPDDDYYSAATMVAMNSTGKAPLLFANLDAELYGADLSLLWQLSPAWQWSATASYVRGKRRDINDNLYRIAPPNWRNQLSYQWQDWQFNLDWLLVAKQNKVSATNSEQTTAGYGLLGVSADWDLGFATAHAGIDNLFDKQYADHLGGYNRVMGVEQGTGERLYQEGRSIWVKFNFSL